MFSIILWVLAFVAVFAVGVAAGLCVVSVGFAAGFKAKTDCWISYSKKRKCWEILGDLPACYAMALSDPNLKRKFDS